MFGFSNSRVSTLIWGFSNFTPLHISLVFPNCVGGGAKLCPKVTSQTFLRHLPSRALSWRAGVHFWEELELRTGLLFVIERCKERNSLKIYRLLCDIINGQKRTFDVGRQQKTAVEDKPPQIPEWCAQPIPLSRATKRPKFIWTFASDQKRKTFGYCYTIFLENSKSSIQI